MRILHNGNKVVTQKLSKTLSTLLKAIIATHIKICTAAYRDTGIRHMWLVQDMKPVLDIINLLNQDRTARNLRTADFPTLYTKIPHDDLLNILTQGVEEAFQLEAKKSEKEVVLLFGYNDKKKKKVAYFGSKPQKGNKFVTKEKLIDMLKYLINNIYSTLGDKIFKQDIGIPMGTDCAPFLANFYLHLKEYNWIRKMLQAKETKQVVCKHFNNCSRYLDDFLGLNNDNKLEEYRDEIYGLRIDVTNDDNDTEGNYCNLKLKIENGHINVDLYNKRDAYDFDIISFTHASSNTNKATDMNVIHGQLHTYLKVCARLGNFVARVRMDLHKMVNINKQSKKGLSKRVWKFLKNNRDQCLNKYSTNIKDIATLLFQNLTTKATPI
jgi:hypothetical protein